MNMTDSELLRTYAKDRSETAFEELVRRHIDLVYSAALRQMNGDAHLAEDVTQSVFADLARKARRLTGHTSLTGWLYTSTRFVAANIRRSEQRRSARELEAHAMNTLLESAEPELDWARIRPLLDEAMHTLDEPDREAVLLRHFERRSYAEIGARFGLSENAARMRVDRSLDKLHAVLAKRGVTSTALALAGVLTANAVVAAPSQLLTSVVQAALAGGTAAGGLVVVLTQFVAAWKMWLTAATVIAAAIVVSIVASGHRAAGVLKKVATVPSAADTNAAGGIAPPPMTRAAGATTASPATNQSLLHLQIVAADSGKPVPLVLLQCHWRRDLPGRTWGNSTNLVANRFGVCDVDYPSPVSELEIRSQSDGFADTRLLWRPDRGEVIPTNYVLRLDRATPIGGRVVDADGKPIAGVEIDWHLEEDPGGVVKVPESHEFRWIETTTDKEGRWRVERIAEDMFRRLVGYARHTNYLEPYWARVSAEPRLETELRNGTHVFKMGRAVTAVGTVVDSTGAPVGGAKVLIGGKNVGGSREGETEADGTFSIPGCAPGRVWATAEATGYAATTVVADLTAEAQPIRLVLERGKVLRLRVVDRAGNPIPGTQVYLCSSDGTPTESDQAKRVQTAFQVAADRDGRVVWTQAPEGELLFGFSAPGYVEVDDVRIPADGEEHPVTLAAALVVHGRVRDQSTGQLLPRFRIGLGYPGLSNGTTDAAWARFDRFWVEFTNGNYLYRCDEPLVRGGENRGYILKFEAEGHAAYVSRIIRPDETDVQLDAALRPATNTTVTVFKPDGWPAVHADVGLVFPGLPLDLVPGGLSRHEAPGGSLMATDKKGTFELRPDDSVARVIVVCADGYAEATPAALVANPIMQLQPWGRLEVSGMTPAGRAAGRNYTFEFGGGWLVESSTSAFADSPGTGGQGKTVFSHFPPGRHKVVRLHLRPVEDKWRNWAIGEKTPFEIRPGETTTLDLAASTYTVTAQLRWPAGMQRQPQWSIAASLQTPMPFIPPDARTNQTARAALLQSAAFKAAQENFRRYATTVKDDGTILAEEVEPGTYVLGVSAVEMPGTGALATAPATLRLEGHANVTVPADPPAGTLDVGEIELEHVQSQQ